MVRVVKPVTDTVLTEQILAEQRPVLFRYALLQLSLRERFSVWLHVMMCTRCRNFQTQSRFIRKAARCYSDALQSRLDRKL
ncbi:MAG: hypothetical protein ACXWT4_07730 [Methylobacter sp.]